ncbi:oxidoreductase [Aestuariimicrobium ganziense]|uniref:oxidoreductase n=1 Tax=Aestuariimicrobium ganziense TaxID=2773677 RepID=UPI0019440568|nr:oxidoreductase [Aestuariimicrobium ganziense]
MRTWLITGASSGLGRALAQAVLDNGEQVVLAVRRPESVQDLVDAHPETAHAVALDVTDPGQVVDAVTRAEARFGAIDVLVNNAGYGYRAAIEEGDDAGVRKLFETNLFGPVNLIKAALPGMRARRSGTIVNLSSIAASRPLAGSGYYASSKAALEGITASLAEDVAPLGIRAILIEPGGFRTEFGGRSIEQSPTRIDDYMETSGSRRPVEGVNPSLNTGGDPAKAAQTIITLVDMDNPPRFIGMGSDAHKTITASLQARLDAMNEHRDLVVSSDADA